MLFNRITETVLILFKAAMTVNSRVIATFLGWSEGATDVPLNDGLRVQILPSMAALPRARKHQYAAFLNLEKILVVWDDDAMHLVTRAKDIESQMMDLVWQTGEPDESEEAGEKKGPNVTEVEIDEESGEILPQHRATHLLNTILVGFTLILIVTVLGAGFRALAIEVAVDHSMLRLAFVALTPVQVFFTLVSRTTRSISCPILLTCVFAVLRTGHCWLSRSVHWSRATDADEFEILFCEVLTKNPRSYSASYYGTMPCIQRGSALCHCANGQVDQGGHLDVRIARWLCQYVHQRRRPADHQ